ncbi:hypothetical protein CP061683_0326B, partial [Chlamydia psittaci 06-1683]
CRYTTVFNQSR